MPDDRVHDVSAMTDGELERARRHLMVSLSLAFPGSPVRGPILAHISAIGVHHHPAWAGAPARCPGGEP